MSVLAAPGTARSAFHTLAISRIDRLCDDAVAVTFEEAPFSFRPGEHVTVRRTADGIEHRRSYSICATVGDPLRIGVRRVPGGAVSGWLVDEAAVGDVLDVQAPTGRFVVDPASGGRHVLVAAGSGITPLLSVASSLLRSSDARVTLVYGNRRAGTTMFLDELADLKDRYPERFELIHVLSREPRDVDLFSGRLDGARLTAILGALVPVSAVDGFWLCGPFAMVEEHRQALAGMGVPSDRVRAELFHVDEPPPPVVHAEEVMAGSSCRVDFVLDGRATTVTSPRTRTVLEAAQGVRPDVPFACRGGVCGTCRAKVVGGEVAMRRNYALEDDEVAAGFVLTCQALPLGDAVSVDFDA